MSNILLRPKNSRCQSHQQKEQEIHAQLCGGTYDFAHVAVAIDLNSSRFQLYDVRCVERDLCTLLPVMSEILSDCCARNLTIFYGAQSQHSRVQHASVLTVHGSVLTDGISRKVEKRVDHKIGLIPNILDGSRTHLTSNYSDSGDLLQQLTLIWFLKERPPPLIQTSTHTFFPPFCYLYQVLNQCPDIRLNAWFCVENTIGTTAPPWNLTAGYNLPSGGQSNDTTLALKLRNDLVLLCVASNGRRGSREHRH
eukprot:g16579.t1